MDYEVKSISMEDEFKICPACGYTDGFHSIFKKEGTIIRWLQVCPACHQVFDIGLNVA
jgi:RNA polymerase subunit RPABC4/transcription elongation factor Spt4